MKRFLSRFFCLLGFFLFVLSVLILSSGPVVATGNLVSWWTFDESSGNATDASGSGLTLTNNNVTYTTGKINGAASFNGTNSEFSGTGPDLSNKSFSISGWLYANNLNASQVWLSLGGSGGVIDDSAIHLRVTTTGGLRFGFFFDDLDTPDNVFTAGTWHQVTYTYDVTNRARVVYIDGVEEANDTAGADFSGTTDLTIGSWAGAEYWNGKIDDVKIYNRVLTSPEIADLAAGGGGPDVPTPTPTQSLLPNIVVAPSCADAKPTTVPDLFQIDTNSIQAKLYFTPVHDNTTDYFISYGYTPGDMRFGTKLSGNSTGVMSSTLNSLSPNVTYYVRVRAGNGCATGGWSNEMKITTAKKESMSGKRYFENFAMQVIVSINRLVSF